jgi:hypothetical protein
VTYHLRNPGNVVVTTTDEANHRLPRILAQDADPGETGGVSAEVRVYLGPFLVEGAKVNLEAQIMPQQRFCVVYNGHGS